MVDIIIILFFSKHRKDMNHDDIDKIIIAEVYWYL